MPVAGYTYLHVHLATSPCSQYSTPPTFDHYPMHTCLARRGANQAAGLACAAHGGLAHIVRDVCDDVYACRARHLPHHLSRLRPQRCTLLQPHRVLVLHKSLRARKRERDPKLSEHRPFGNSTRHKAAHHPSSRGPRKTRCANRGPARTCSAAASHSSSSTPGADSVTAFTPASVARTATPLPTPAACTPQTLGAQSMGSAHWPLKVNCSTLTPASVARRTALLAPISAATSALNA